MVLVIKFKRPSSVVCAIRPEGSPSDLNERECGEELLNFFSSFIEVDQKPGIPGTPTIQCVALLMFFLITGKSLENHTF